MTALPLPGALRRAAYRKQFLANREDNLFMGSFESFAAAEAAAPPGTPVGYDNAQAAQALYSHQIYDWDYPALFWLGRAFDAGMRTVLDVGGHVGIKYYAFRRVLDLPPELHWTVCDVPAVVQAGRELATQRGATAQLDFCTTPAAAPPCDVLLLSGSLQYLPTDMPQLLATLKAKPRRIVLNITAMHESRTLYTLNSIGFAVCPYRIQQQEQLFKDLSDAGYKRRDAWRNIGKPIAVPFVDGGDQAFYGGCCFDRN